MKWPSVTMKDSVGLGTRRRHKNTAGRSVVFVHVCVSVFIYLFFQSGDQSPGRWASGDERQRQTGEH